MSGVAYKLEIAGLDAAVARLNALGTIDFHSLLDSLGRRGMEQTRERLEVEKTAPSGAAWPKTTDGRAALFVTGTLAKSIDHTVSGDAAIWGVHAGGKTAGARIHQFGGVIKPVNGKALHFKLGGKDVFAKKVTIPARPYVGISKENARDLEHMALESLAGALARLGT